MHDTQPYVTCQDLTPLSMNMGNTLLKQAKYEEAFESYRQVQKLRPDFALTHYNLGVAYAKRGQREKAEKEFVRALELNPDFSEAQKTLDAVRNEMTSL